MVWLTCGKEIHHLLSIYCVPDTVLFLGVFSSFGYTTAICPSCHDPHFTDGNTKNQRNCVTFPRPVSGDLVFNPTHSATLLKGRTVVTGPTGWPVGAEGVGSAGLLRVKGIKHFLKTASRQANQLRSRLSSQCLVLF